MTWWVKWLVWKPKEQSSDPQNSHRKLNTVTYMSITPALLQEDVTQQENP